MDKMVDARMARANIATAQDTEKMDFIRNHPTEVEFLPQMEEIILENPTLSYEQARVLYLAEHAPDRVYDPAQENRERLARQSSPGMSVSSEEKSLDNLSSNDIAAAGKQLLASGKITNNF
jgi:U3 small nucleolar ribonucleoprotein component